ncbi:MAG: NADH-quinone oxidoreductase subunit NuoF [Candidatus Eremiobacteraeota bacterium]|nr:NADH-quinone oxidoreductase subunit NuoF [Candidatus Eremiobacteraeota bacterium]
MPVVKVLTEGIGEFDLADIAVYRERGGYEQWKRALTEMQPADVADITLRSGLRGRGGAGFPTGRKWSFLPNNGRPRYMVCNCDEAEPGTFKDHMLLEETPHQVLEGILLGTYAIGSQHAFIYIRGEFERGYRTFVKAVEDARAAGLLGENLFGTAYSVEVTVQRGAGAYICGEETALINSLEGRRGEPRLKPPFPAVKGLYGEPTVVNNVETLATLPHLLRNGPEWFSQVGPERSPGYKIVSVSGHVKSPGNYEVPLGTPLRELLDIAGGPRDGRKIVAVQPGGGSSACLFEEHLDLGYDFDTMAANGTMLGSGAVVFFDDTTNFVEAALALVRFYAHESCGQCTPCREGGHWLEVTLERILGGGGLDSDIDLLVAVSHQMTGLNLCPLGDSIEPFLASVVKRFETQFRSYVRSAQREAISA